MVERRREDGLTLVEVLVSLVLLTLLTTAALPLLRAAGQLRETRANVALFDELAMLADRVVTHPEAFGLTEPPRIATLAWPEHGGREPITLRTVGADGHAKQPECGLQLVLFECDDVAVARWWPSAVPVDGAGQAAASEEDPP